MDAQLVSVLAEIEAVKARIEAMKLENSICDKQGVPPRIEPYHFYQAEQELMALSVTAHSIVQSKNPV